MAVVTEYPLGYILYNKEANDRIIKWAPILALAPSSLGHAR
jgi:hypothetical protein